MPPPTHPTGAPAGLVERSSYPSDRHTIDVWVMRPDTPGPLPVMIYNHGSGVGLDGKIDAASSTLSSTTPPWPCVLAGTCAVMFPEGRGYGASTGPKLADCSNWSDVWCFLKGRSSDVVAAARWLEGQVWADTSRLLLLGCSHGGIVSLLAQAEIGVCGTVAQAPGVGDHAQEVANRNLIGALQRSKAPVFLQHALHDLHAPIEFSRSLQRLGRDGDKDITLREYPFRRATDSHAQFNWCNRDIWGADFDRFAGRALGVNGPLVSA